MPDWSYRTALRPLLFALPPAAARDLSLGAMGTLARLPLGPALIDFLGHMRADRRLARERLGIAFPTPVGLGAGVDVAAAATPAFARFGLGLIEVGPVTAGPRTGAGPIGRDARAEALEWPDPPDNPGAAALAERLARDARRRRVPIVARLAVASADDAREMAGRLAPHVEAFSLAPIGAGDGPPAWLGDAVRAVAAVAPGPARLVVVPADLEEATICCWVASTRDAGAGGLLVDGTLRQGDGRRLLGPAARGPALRLVRRLREAWPDAVLVASAGVREPFDAVELLSAGADLALIDAGLVFTGPGLPKRCNEAVLAAEGAANGDPLPRPDPDRPPERAWFWTLLLGLGMLVGSLAALIIAATRVVLPYDEAYVGLSRDQMAAVNPHLLGFLTHDRVTLAGVMVTIGVQYAGLSVHGVRRGLHWAYMTVVSSAWVGFASFFLFLGFGYFDPFHAFVTALLFQFLLLALHSRLGEPERPRRADLFNDRAWRLSLWGQLLVIAQAGLFVAAGVVISLVGITQVFVPEDLEFMHTHPEALAAASHRLIPMIAHDRASLGGMLVVSGLGFLLPALWGYRRGERWLWWTLVLAGLPGFGATIAVHLAVGYLNLWHLAPAFVGVALLGGGLGLSYPYLAGRARAGGP